MKLCNACGTEVPYQGFGRPREYCDDCRFLTKHRPEPTCDWCGWDFEGGSGWQKYCCDECRTNALGVWEKPAPPPPPPLQGGLGPWVWEVGERFLVTTRNRWPKNSGESEQIRCSIIGNFPNKETAHSWIKTYTERLNKLRTF